MSTELSTPLAPEEIDRLRERMNDPSLKPLARMQAKITLANAGLIPEEEGGEGSDHPDPAPTPGNPRSLLLVGEHAGPFTPPQNLDAEAALIAGMVRDNERIDELLGIAPPPDYSGQAQSFILHHIAEMRARGEHVNLVTLAERLAGDPRALRVGARAALDAALATERADADQLRSFARIVADKARKRELGQLSRELAQQTHSGRPLASILETVERRVAELGERDRSTATFDESAFAFRSWPRPRDEAHLHGIAGEIIRTIDPLTEADPMAILGQFLIAFGNIAGRDPCWYHESSRHGANLFLVVAGPTAFGCKGTSLDVVEDILEGCDPTWMEAGLDGGLISGEGLIHAVRDPSEADRGVEDKRILCVEIEFGTVLTAMSRKGNTLSPQIRKAWDGKPFGLMSRNAPTRSSGYHISIIGHITLDELDRKFANDEAMNGFGNRFLWLCSRQSKTVPRAGRRRRVDWEKLGFRKRIREALEFVESESDQKHGLVLVLEKKADRLWDEVSARLKKPVRGILGAIRGRAAPQVMRLAMIYALLDRSSFIRVEHIEAALTFWDYCEQSAAFIFGEVASDPDVDQLHAALLQAGAEGLSLTEIRRKVFKNHGEATKRMRAALESLYRSGMAEPKGDPPSVNVARRWFARG